jgi:hypothetical protein
MGSTIKLKNIHLIKQKRISNSIYQQQLNEIASILFIGEKICRKIIEEF